MKAFMRLELFGEDFRQQMKLYRLPFRATGNETLFNHIVGIPPRSSWIAEICGPNEKYGLERKFLKAHIDYSKSNARGSRGVFAEYLLTDGKIYEVKSQETWTRYRRFFCIVDADGEIIEIDEEVACHAVGALTSKERREKRNAKKIS